MLGAGCVGDDGPTVILQGMVSPTRDSNGVCTYDPSNPYVLYGSLNFGDGAMPYQMYAAAANTIVTRGNAVSTDPNSLAPESFEVEIREFNGARLGFPGLPNPFLVPAAGAVIGSRSGNKGTVGVVAGTGIPIGYSEILAGKVADSDGKSSVDITLNVNLNARTSGDSEVKSDRLVWGVALFADDQKVACPPKNTSPTLCSPGQDGSPLGVQYYDPGSVPYAAYCEN